MMPFSVLRVWGTGILSWAILGGAIYCFWQWQDHRQAAKALRRPAAVAEAAPRAPDTELGPQDRDRPAIVQAHETSATRHLLAGLGLLALGFGGFLPVTLLLGRPGSSSPRVEHDGDRRFIDRPSGARLYVEVHGPQHGPTIIFTHGWSLDSTAWNYVKHELTRRYRVVVWDLPGLGRSRGPANGDYRLEKMADDLGAVIEAVGKPPIILVGHSIGGMITQTYCRLYPRQLRDRVAGIVLLHTTYTNPLRTAFLAPLWTALERPLIVPLNHLTIWLAPLAWLSNWQSYLNGTLQIFTRFASFAGRQTWRHIDHGSRLAAKAWPAVVARGNLAMLDFHEDLTLRDIEVPVLVLAAAYDRMTRPEASAHMEKRLPHGLPATIRGGHLGFWERNEEVAALLIEFIQRAAPTKAPAAQQSPLPAPSSKASK